MSFPKPDFIFSIMQRLVTITRKAIAQEVESKYAVTSKERSHMKKRLATLEYSTLLEYMTVTMRSLDEIIVQVTQHDKTFAELLTLTQECTAALQTRFMLDEIIMPGLMSESLLNSIIFEDLIKLQSSVTRVRYMALGRNYKEFKEFLKDIQIKHPDDF